MESMPDIFQFRDYRDWLSATFANRVEKNPQLSISSLASKVGMSQSLLSLILRGKRKLTFARADAVADFLELSTRERTYLHLLIQFEQTREIHSREAIERKLLEFRGAEVEAQVLSLSEAITRKVKANPQQIEKAKQAMLAFADQLEAILSEGEKTSLVKLSLAIH